VKEGYDYESEINSVFDKPKKNQVAFSDNIDKFLLSDYNYLISRGGMGLGKTLATAVVIKKYLEKFDHIYIATPFSRIKSVWCKEMNNIHLNKEITEWISKTDCIEPLHPGNVKLCDDDCKHWGDLEKNGKFTDECFKILESKKFPEIAIKWYEENGTDLSLWPIIRCGLKYRNIAIGDFYPMFNQPMFSNMIIKKTGRDKTKSLLIIDEAHKLIQRAEDFYSKELDLTFLIKQLEKKQEIYKLVDKSKDIFVAVINGVDSLKKIEKLLKRKSKKEENKCGQIRYTYKNFQKDFENINPQSLEYFIMQLKNATKFLSSEEWETEDDPYLKRLYTFINFWQEKYNNENYGEYYQYSEYGNQNVKLKISCQDLSTIIPKLFSNWKKVILLSGTIHPEFQEVIGLDKLETLVPNELNSFTIKENVCVYSSGIFKKGYDLINEILELHNIIKHMNGRILIFVKNKNIGNKLYLELKGNNIFNLCSVQKERFKIMAEEFANTQSGIAILNIRGTIEGQNFINQNNDAIENIVVFGYPFLIPNFEYEDKLKYYSKKYDNKIGRGFLEFIPIGNLIHQAVCRAKRNDSDNPKIIIWDKWLANWSEAYKYLPDDLKGFSSSSFPEVISWLKNKNDKRNTS